MRLKKAQLKIQVCGNQRFPCLGFLNKKGQIKIQEMAFMLVAVIFFFVLVGIFIMTLFYFNIYESATEIAERRTLSSITNLADSPEFACQILKSNCIDGDKIISLVDNEVYENFWPFSSLKVVKLSGFGKKQDELIECNFANYDSCSGTPETRTIYECTEVKNPKKEISAGSGEVIETLKAGVQKMIWAKRGPWENVRGYAPGGNAMPPTPDMILGDIKPNEKIKLTGITGSLTYYRGYTPCREMDQVGGGFYHPTNNNIKYSQHTLKEFENGVRAPNEPGVDSYRVIFYQWENYRRRNPYMYHDNGGSCSFMVHKVDETSEESVETKIEEKCVAVGTEVMDLCDPCDVFTIYDKEVENERAISSFVTICRKEEESGFIYDKCDIAKIVAGTELKVVEER